MPKDSITKPAVVFKPADPKITVLPWDSSRALKLWQKRQSYQDQPLPNVFTKESDVTEAPHGIIGRNRLVLKAKNSAGLKYYTTNNE